MTHRTKFQENWLSRKDKHGDLVSSWCQREENIYSFFCKICNSSYSCAKGFGALSQHSETTKHEKNRPKIAGGQRVLIPPTAIVQPTATTQPMINIQPSTDKNSQQQKSNATQSQKSGGNQNVISMFSLEDESTRAELFYIMDLVVNNGSVNACNDKKYLFRAMFPRGVPESFSLSATKVSYNMTDALGPHFLSRSLVDLRRPNTKFVLQFDESPNSKKKKELQVRVSFWSESLNRIVNRHLVTYFIPRGDAKTLFEFLNKSLCDHDLSFLSVLTLGCDGPNVNKSVINLCNTKMRELGRKEMINIGTCLLHVVNNTFMKGVNSLPLDVSDGVIKLYYFVDHSELRVQNFENVQKSMNMTVYQLVHHCTVRWLTLGEAAETTLKLWPAIEEFILVYILKNDKDTVGKQNYKEVREFVNNPLTKPSLEYVAYLSKIFTREFTLLMQKTEPLIHIVHSQLTKLVHILLKNFIKPSSIPNDVLDIPLIKSLEDGNVYLQLEEMNCGTGCSK
ncbi:hypothetical protein QAD02_013678 [Eretmocerus hayati]|uniref:Uncharacterized protein n=1 Tax=Eretmocerus hayati TaxID=131215 RepID=A0ACC2P4X7_9HYME|nr:hypothetical protein QAD02_013678 [Eretmocerus hayati]